jgi:protoporphyrinogen oxidase
VARRFAIIGGGFLGQTLALRLAQQGAHVTLFEAADHLGGLADAWQVGPVTWDRHYHVTLLSDIRLRRLLDELGLADELHWGQTRTGFYSGGRLHSLSSSLDFLRFSPLRFTEKLRLAWTIAYASRIRDWRPLDRVAVEDWLRRHSGDRVFEKIWRPLLASKLGEAYRDTSAAFIWATINRMYAARRNGMKREMFGYVWGGYARVLGRLGERLAEVGVDVRLASPVGEIASGPSSVSVTLLRRNEGPWDRQAVGPEEHRSSAPTVLRSYGPAVEYQTDRSTTDEFDHVVVTLPPPQAARLCPQLSADQARSWRDVRMLGVVCLSVILRRPLGGYYVTNITDEGFPFTGVIEMTALVDRREFNERTLIYLPKYVPGRDPLFEEDDAAIFDRFFAGLVRMFPDLSEGDVVAWRVSRAPHVMAVPEIGYARRVPPVETPLPGVSLVSSAQIVNNTLNVNATIDWAEACVPHLLSARHVGERAPFIARETANVGNGLCAVPD